MNTLNVKNYNVYKHTAHKHMHKIEQERIRRLRKVKEERE